MKRSGSLEGEWCQVAGGIEGSETAWQAALRELNEETGLTTDKIYSADINEQFYVAERNVFEIIPVFVCYVSKEAVVVLNEEHSEFAWVGIDDAKEMVGFPGQRRVLEHLKTEFVQNQPSDWLKIDVSTVT